MMLLAFDEVIKLDILILDIFLFKFRQRHFYATGRASIDIFSIEFRIFS